MRKRDLIIKRDRCIVEKFYQLYDVKRMRMDDVLTELSQNHFYLDPNYIYSRIFYTPENNTYYQELLEKNKQKTTS